MAKGAALVRFTPLVESSGGRLRSKPTEGGRRVYEGVTIIKAGLGNKRDRNYYPPEMLESSVDRFDGLRAYADHQDSLSEEVQPERTVRDLVGVYKNPQFVREGRGGRIKADLHLFRSSRWLSDTVDDLIELGQADKIGLSINGRGRTVERQIQLEESADPINVNWVEDFMVLRSADVVTEAGAGGGFPQLLESARGSTQEKAMKLTEQQKKALKEAVDAGDVDKLNALLKECGCTTAEAAPAAPKKKEAKPAKIEQTAEADDDDSGEDGDDLDAAADEIVAEADDDDSGEDDLAEADDDDSGDADDAADAADDPEADAADDGDPARESLAEVSRKGAGKLMSGTPGGKHGRTIKGPKSGGGSFVKPAKGQGTGQKGRRFGEADVERLTRQNDRLKEENARLSAQLKVRTTADRAKNLLRESAIPRKMQPDVLRLMVGKSEDEMRRVVRYHERLIESAVEEIGGTGVEGAGTRFRESYHGGGSDLSSVVEDVGLPLKD